MINTEAVTRSVLYKKFAFKNFHGKTPVLEFPDNTATLLRTPIFKENLRTAGSVNRMSNISNILKSIYSLRILY